MIAKQRPRFGVKDVASKVTRQLADGTKRRYSYKLFRVYLLDGTATTASMEFDSYFRLCSRFKIGQAEVSSAFRQAARLMFARGERDRAVSFSSQIRTCAIHLLTAQAKGVSLDEYESALVNNEAWTV